LISLSGIAQFDNILDSKIDLIEIKVDTIHQKLNSVLIIGMGASLSRIFRNNLSNLLIKELSEDKVNAEYYFAMNMDELNDINKNNYNTILYILQNGRCCTKNNNLTNQ
jgi:hypothetical protein